MMREADTAVLARGQFADKLRRDSLAPAGTSLTTPLLPRSRLATAFLPCPCFAPSLDRLAWGRLPPALPQARPSEWPDPRISGPLSLPLRRLP